MSAPNSPAPEPAASPPPAAEPRSPESADPRGVAPPDLRLVASLDESARAELGPERPDGATNLVGIDVIGIGVQPGPQGAQPGEGAEWVQATYGAVLAAHLTRAKATGEAGEVVQAPAGGDPQSPALVLVGTGDRSSLALRRAGAALARTARGRSRLVTTLAGGTDEDGLRAVVEGLVLGSYTFTRRREPKRPLGVSHIDLVVAEPSAPATQAALRRGQAAARAGWLARDLANTPSQEKDPQWLADRAGDVARDCGLGVRIRDEVALADEGFNGILAVGMGSARPPRLIELSYDPPDPAADRDGGEQGLAGAVPHVVLVGKGITFDSGGLSLKPAEAMVPMKTDMAAGGAVIATMGALAELGVRARVTGLVPAAENLPSGTAQRPGDVIKQYGGTTVEVLNTDAEGRLVLADALAYAIAELAPDVVVDLATLTGAASRGLGRRHAALFTADDELAADLIAAGQGTGERLWRMPLVEDYRPALDSEVADIANVSRDPDVQGGAILAALFLREFVGATRWAHLDIAGPARAESEEHEVSKGGTGFGARLLLRWLEALP